MMTVKEIGVVAVSNNTEVYLEDWHFYKCDKRLFMASHWVDDNTGECVKLTHNLKAVYFHKLDNYRGFARCGRIYNESHQTVADKLGISLKTVEEVAIPLLKRMGLIHIQKLAHKRYITTVFSLDNVRGDLINDKLKKHYKPLEEQQKKKKPMTHNEFKNTEKNKKNLERIKKDMTGDLVVFKKEDFDRLMKRDRKEDVRIRQA